MKTVVLDLVLKIVCGHLEKKNEQDKLAKKWYCAGELVAGQRSYIERRWMFSKEVKVSM